jgi:Ca2+-transporting ATPase
MRSMTRSIFAIGLFSNIYVTITMVSSAVITIAIIEIPFFKDIFGFGEASTLEFITIVICSSLVLWAGEVYKYFQRFKRI